MKETLVWDDNSDREEVIQSVNRRRFLQTIGVAGAGLLFAPKDAFSAEPVQNADAGRWRDRVTGFVSSVFEGSSKGEAINSRLYSAALYYAPDSSDFHSRFWAPYVFSIRIGNEIVICSNGFEVDRFPYYATSCPCGSMTDLNAWEIRRIINPKEKASYGCVVVPTGERTRFEYSDHADYRKTFGYYPDLGDISDYRVEYKRVFHSKPKRKSYYAYGVVHKTEVAANGKPIKDVLLSADDV